MARLRESAAGAALLSDEQRSTLEGLMATLPETFDADHPAVIAVSAYLDSLRGTPAAVPASLLGLAIRFDAEQRVLMYGARLLGEAWRIAAYRRLLEAG